MYIRSVTWSSLPTVSSQGFSTTPTASFRSTSPPAGSLIPSMTFPASSVPAMKRIQPPIASAMTYKKKTKNEGCLVSRKLQQHRCMMFNRMRDFTAIGV